MRAMLRLVLIGGLAIAGSGQAQIKGDPAELPSGLVSVPASTPADGWASVVLPPPAALPGGGYVIPIQRPVVLHGIRHEETGQIQIRETSPLPTDLSSATKNVLKRVE